MQPKTACSTDCKRRRLVSEAMLFWIPRAQLRTAIYHLSRDNKSSPTQREAQEAEIILTD